MVSLFHVYYFYMDVKQTRYFEGSLVVTLKKLSQMLLQKVQEMVPKVCCQHAIR